MNEEQRTAMLNAQVACAMIQAMGMQAANQNRAHKGMEPCYLEQDFENVIANNGIGFNSAITTLQGR